MKHKTLPLIQHLFFSIIIFSSAGCTAMSETKTDTRYGINGSFEHTKDGLPVNWLLYTPNTIKDADFDISIDTTVFKEGKQSLKFSVRRCSAMGGRFSPGLDQEFDAHPGETYRISFWIINNGTDFTVKISGVSALHGIDGPVLRSQESTNSWKQYEYAYTIPSKMNALRFEMNILHPGTLWIDDIKIERTKTTN